MAGGAAVEVPTLTYLVVGLIFMLGWVILRGLHTVYISTFGFLFVGLASILDFKVWRFHINLGGPVASLDHEIRHLINAGAAKAEHGMGYFFHGAARLQEWASSELRQLGAEVYDALYWLQHVHLPSVTRIVGATTVPRALVARYARAAVAPEIARLERLVRSSVHGGQVVITQAIEIPYLSEWQWLHRHWRALEQAIAGSTAGALAGRFPWVHVFPRLHALDLEGLHIRRRLRRVEALLGVTGLAIALANVLGLPNWRCLTRGNVGRTARALCGIPYHVLNDLLGLLLDFAVLTDVCQAVGWLDDALTLVEPELTAFVTGLSTALCHGDYSPPEPFTVAGLTETPAQLTLGLAA